MKIIGRAYLKFEDAYYHNGFHLTLVVKYNIGKAKYLLERNIYRWGIYDESKEDYTLSGELNKAYDFMKSENMNEMIKQIAITEIKKDVIFNNRTNIENDMKKEMYLMSKKMKKTGVLFEFNID
jgi:hypothetical protein